MNAFNVSAPNGAPIFHNGIRSICEDTVYYCDSYTEEDVRDSLINHDGYNSDIIVELAK